MSFSSFSIAQTIVLTSSSPDAIIEANSQSTTIYGTKEPNNITVKTGAKAELVNFPGENTITFESDTSNFRVFRSGAMVSFLGDYDTTLKIPATSQPQTINFTDKSGILKIESGRVMMHDQEIETNPEMVIFDIYSIEPNLTHHIPSGWSDKIVLSTTTGITTNSSTLYETDTLYVNWAIINNGTSSISTIFYTTLYVDNVEIASWYADSLLSNHYINLNEDYSIGELSTGTHTIKIVADTTDAISESNEYDNEYTKTITISPIDYTTGFYSQLVGTWGVEEDGNYIYFDVDEDGRIFNISAKLPVKNTLSPYDNSSVTLDNFKCTIINSDAFTFSVSKSEGYGNGWAEKSMSLNGTFYDNSGEIWVNVDWSAQDAIATASSYKGSGTASLQKIDADIDPGPEEICGNGIDDDCDGNIDEHCPPKDVSATDGIYSDKVRITWAASTTATIYEIWRSKDTNSSSATKVGTATEIYYEDYDGETEQIYYYWVKATSNDVDFGSFSTSDTGYKIDPPAVPDVEQMASTDNYLGIEIKWYASDRAESYEVWRSKEMDSSSAILIATTTDTSYLNFNDFDFGGGTFYYYWIKANNSAGKSDFSLTIFGRVKPTW